MTTITTPIIEERAEQPYVGIRSSVRMGEIAGTIPPLMGEVFAFLAERGIEPTDAPFWRYLVIDMARELVIDVGVPVATAAQGEGRIIADVLPAGRYATTEWRGSYDGLMDATGQLLAWGDSQGVSWDKQPDGDTGEAWAGRIEVYFTDPDELPDPNDWVTQLAFKLAD
ncbi:GyrI-like domain-containing protein [Rathayibacter sp. YIM 133350]|uniref:GyrI-like domain-containing protein n=1 Tax=Rathayibacter sp. YIM 133350 TaxID=3131992 RepID=UPI00307E4158